MKKPAELGAIDIAAVQSRMLTIRNQQVLLDRDVAALYGVETKEINQAIRNNPGKFPEGFVFQLNEDEFENWKSKILTSNLSAREIAVIKMGIRRAPYALTERGLYMLATILKGEVATRATLAIVNTYAQVRSMVRDMEAIQTEKAGSPEVAHGAYPARKGEKGAVQAEVFEACRAIEDIVWGQRRPSEAFSVSPDGRLATELLSQNTAKERHTRFIMKLKKGVLRKIGWAVEFELRARIGHLEAVVAHLDIEIGSMKRVDSQCERMKAVAWQIVGGNYGPWFTYRTRFLYDIYSAIQHEEGHWRYSTVHPLVPSVPLMEISRCV